jgi:uroporphyrinogen-III synthase
VPVLLTRPSAQSESFAGLLRARLGERWPIVISPLLEIVSLPVPASAMSARGFLFTSQNGVAALAGAQGLAGRPAFCVGARTADAARAAGFDAVAAEGDVTSLAALVVTRRPEGPLLHVSGEEVRGDLAGALAAAGIAAERVVAYTQRPVPLAEAARSLLAGEGPVTVPLFSPRSAALLAREGPFRARLRLVALSQAVAREARALGAESCAVCDRPESAAMIAAIARSAGGAGPP